MGFKVTQTGLSTTIQDLGRSGYQHLGVTRGGAMDEYSFRWANRLLGNPENSAMLEITYGGFGVEIDSDTNIALTGGDLGAKLNNIELEPWSSYRVRAGDQLLFTVPRNGLRAYLAVSGGVLSPVSLGSRSVVIREGLGGLGNGGQKLLQGDYLLTDPYPAIELTRVPEHDIPDYTGDLQLGVIEGYQIADFSRTEIRRFFSSEYQVSQNIDRMGYRLSGAALKPSRTGIISEGIAAGAIQVPADGQPIVLMSDRQTIGGYPKLGCVSALDLSLLSQRGPGSMVGFYPMDLAIAQAQKAIFHRHLKHFKLHSI